ncbi:DUF3396 domain-containing protein [Pyxidicoccus xibeiensis]|uniref:DUF3396 domain-containing protein n=1 Tax=Pyxidicoccus xibeiensis TaxID=2906759 RepID=UPI0020A810C5|nr:type VI immunity family protein [Pyxidicoccus xibeiensis]MCP3144125.1 DUF3396 domain-containing protein [Pyxidicoccus xibeiensis]
MSITFFMRRTHEEIEQAVRNALGVYCRAVGQKSLGLYDDHNGGWKQLDENGWHTVWQRLSGKRTANIALREGHGSELGYAFHYHGTDFGNPHVTNLIPDATSVVSFWLPTEFMREHGPGRVRELALELGDGLPFNSGQAGLSFLMWSWLRSNTPIIRQVSSRHPGIDIPDLNTLSSRLGTRLRGPAWLTFLGQPVLGELGGVEGLRTRLHAPGTTVQELEGDQAVVTLGEWPEAGDLEQGDTLPHYRELARVLEPWLYSHGKYWGNLTPEETRRWERRFLD